MLRYHQDKHHDSKDEREPDEEVGQFHVIASKRFTSLLLLTYRQVGALKKLIWPLSRH
jgi:hypothetical protein